MAHKRSIFETTPPELSKASSQAPRNAHATRSGVVARPSLCRPRPNRCRAELAQHSRAVKDDRVATVVDSEHLDYLGECIVLVHGASTAAASHHAFNHA